MQETSSAPDDGVIAPSSQTVRGSYLRPITPPRRHWHIGGFDLAVWWDNLEIDLTFGPLLGGLFAFSCFLAAIWLQPFTGSLHFLWMGVWGVALTAVLWWLARYVRLGSSRPWRYVTREEAELEEMP